MNGFTNERGEVINPQLVLLSDPKRGVMWRSYFDRTLPAALFRRFRLIDAEGSQRWANVVEHSGFVAAGVVTLAKDLQARGVAVDVAVAERAAWAHDAAKRDQIERRIRREDEMGDSTFPAVLAECGYNPAEIAAAQNSGRLPDRFLTDPAERQAAIRAKSIEATIVGYVDARTRGSHSLTLQQAHDDSVATKPNESEFFTKFWLPYYTDVEDYFRELAPSWGSAVLSDDAIFATIQQ